MDKDRSKLNSNTYTNAKERSPCGKCSRPDTCIHLRSLRQQQIDTSSTRVIHMGCNFQPNRSADEFFDCQSFETSLPGDYQRSNCGKASNTRKKDGDRFDDPEACRAALERIVNGAQMMLRNFETSKSGSGKPCSATLEITARLITDSKENRPNCQYQSRPVTMKMPLQFDPCTGQLGSKSAASSRQVCNQPCSRNSQSVSNTGRVPHQYRNCHTLSHLSTRSEVFAGTFTPTAPVSTTTTTTREQLIAPELHPQSEMQTQTQTQTQKQLLSQSRSQFKAQSETNSAIVTDLESRAETESMESEETPSKPGVLKRYYMALPQHRDFSSCSPCRYSPSPLMDEEGNVFCPGNCGCCRCPWKPRTVANNRDHVNIKICRCVQRGNIFSSFDERENCSQVSYFDFCPCREKAEAKFLELYDCEMWSSSTATRGPEVKLDEIIELTTPIRRDSV